LPSFGENLRREREKRKITLDQISQSTKIGTRMLQALEGDKFSQLPGGIFNKGFVRAYARCVGLDEEQTVADYLQASGETPPVQPEMPEEEHTPPRIIEARAETQDRPLPWGTFAALLLLAALALTLWSHRQKKERVPAAPPPAAVQPATQPAPQPALGSRSAPAPGANSTAPSTQPASPPQVAPATNPPATPPDVTKPPGQPLRPADGTFLVNIQVREDSWTNVTADGKPVMTGLLTAGDQRAIRAQKEIVIRAGNAGGVDLFFNGKKVPKFGEFGDIKTITFGPEGVTPNAPPPTTQ